MSAPETTIRPAGPTDRPVLEEALLWAVNWSPDRPSLHREQVLARPDFAHYVVGWPGPGDRGLVADVGGRPVGVTWWRYFPVDDPGYGFVSDDVPELSIGVHPEHRCHGIGRRLLRSLLAVAAGADLARVSLSVERANRARGLYLGEGFRVVGGDGGADTMVADLARGGSAYR